MNIEKFTAHVKDVGGIPVNRLLPQRSRRTVGAWCFLDHIGPAEFGPDDAGMQVGAHPHINLQTFTWMLDGHQWHRDSLGNRQMVSPKQVSLMTAGTGDNRGISHTEQSVEGEKSMHAVQFWIALPLNKEIEPGFNHYEELPQWSKDGVDYIVTTGTFDGHTAPTKQHSPLVGVDMTFNDAKTIEVPLEAGWEYGIFVIKGQVNGNDEQVTPEELLVFSETQAGDVIRIEAEAGSHIILIGGEPLPHKTIFWWNFISDNPESLRKGVADWNNKHPRFGDIDLTGTPLTRLVSPEAPETLRS
ncbi:pirin family protein [Neisseria montereyensis]|uniref:Pirin family protein n=1 Tax=Neisseria montereyensis TaxID=2973938 RepID=A0ABT2FD01_9NEIS|nr:pirin family protein [Neisseria montereyensis]MCS4533430.1 pirin family protein [Neisseria montereyensis]